MWHLSVSFIEFLGIYIYNCAYIAFLSSIRVSGRKGPSFQNGEPGNTRQQHVSSKATSTHHNELLPQKGSTRTFKPELIDYQVSSIQHGGMQQKLLLNPTHTQQLFKNSSPHQSFQQDDALTQEGAIRTSRKAFIDHHVPSQHNKGSGNTSHHQISSKPTPIFKPQQVPKHQGHNEEDGLRKTCREQLFDHQSNTCHATEYDNSPFQPQGKFAQHASVHQHGSNYHQNAHGGCQAHQPYRPKNQDLNSTYCDTEYIDPSFQPRGKFNQHANAYQRHSNSHKNAQAHHQVHEPFRPRNQDFNSSDQFFGKDYHQGYHDYSGMTHGQYHPQQSRHQNYYGHRPMTQGQGTQQNHHQNYNGRRKMTQNQYNSRQNQPNQQFPIQRLQPWPCHYYYQQGWCRYGERCWYSHDIWVLNHKATRWCSPAVASANLKLWSGRCNSNFCATNVESSP